MKKLYISSLGQISIKNGGLTNSSIARMAFLAKVNPNDFVIIHYGTSFEKTKETVSYFKEKWEINVDNLIFINAYDNLNENKCEFKEGNYYQDNKKLTYEEYIVKDLQRVLDSQWADACFLFSDTVFSPDLRVNKLNKHNLYKIFTCHNLHLKSNYQNIRWKKDAYRARGYFQPIRDPKTHVLFITKEQKKDVVKREGNLKRFHYMPHKCEFKNLKENITREDKIVLIAIFRPEKKIEKFIKLFNKVKLDIKLEIYGNGPEEDKIVDLIQALNDSRIQLKGRVCDAQSVFQTAKLAVNYAEFEAFGLTIIESMSAGTPVLAQNVKYGPKEIIEDGVNGLLASSDAEAIAKIEKYFNENKFEEYSLNAIKKSQEYGEENYRQRLVNILDEIQKYKVIPLQKSICKVKITRKYVVFKVLEMVKEHEYKVRSYNQNLEDFREYNLRENNRIEKQRLFTKKLSFVIETDSEFEEIELKIGKIEQKLLKRARYQKEEIYGKDNTREEFKFLVIK